LGSVNGKALNRLCSMRNVEIQNAKCKERFSFEFSSGLTRMVSLSLTAFDLDLVRVCLSGAALSYDYFGDWFLGGFVLTWG